MKKTIYSLLGAVAVLAMTACGGSTTSGSTTETDAPEVSAEAKTVSPDNIDASQVKLIITDEAPVNPDSFDARDYAGKTAHNVYDFSESEEIKTYKRMIVTDPEQYENTNRILVDTNWNPVWSEDHTVVTIEKNFFGATSNAADIIRRMLPDYSMTVIMKDGTSYHLDQVPAAE